MAADELSIERTITRVSHHIDHRRWEELRRLFAYSVETDYTSLFGGEVQRQNADDLIAAWRKLLTPLGATQHLLGPIETEISGHQAIASCHVRGYHYLRGAEGGDEWMIAGHYVFGLTMKDGGWVIDRMKLETFYQTGNTKLLEVAGK